MLGACARFAMFSVSIGGWLRLLIEEELPPR
jgi:hypothetical protein